MGGVVASASLPFLYVINADLRPPPTWPPPLQSASGRAAAPALPGPILGLAPSASLPAEPQSCDPSPGSPVTSLAAPGLQLHFTAHALQAVRPCAACAEA